MATRVEIITQFRDEMVTALNGLVDSDDIVVSEGHSEADTPSVTFEEFPSTVVYNGIGPNTRLTYDNQGQADTKEYISYIKDRFDVTVYADSLLDSGQYYEAIRDHFRAYEEYRQDVTYDDFHPDTERLWVRDDSSDRDRPQYDIRGQPLTIYVVFESIHERNVDPIETVNVDDKTSGSGFEYTISL